MLKSDIIRMKKVYEHMIYLSLCSKTSTNSLQTKVLINVSFSFQGEQGEAGEKGSVSSHENIITKSRHMICWEHNLVAAVWS